jgi:tetratricopeptide (TPR) repeat protein
MKTVLHITLLISLCWAAPRETAIAQAQPAAGRKPSDSLLARVITLYAECRFKQLIKLVEPEQDVPASPPIYFYLGSSFAALNDVQNAIHFLRKATHGDSLNTGFRFQLAKILTSSGMADEATRHYKIILAQDSLFVAALSQIGVYALDRHNYTEAAKIFGTVIRLNPRDFLGNYYLGASLVTMEKPDSAVRYFAASMSLNPNYTPCLNLLASIYYKRANYEEAYRLYRSASLLEKDNADLWSKKGLCLEKLQRVREAKECFLKAVELDPASPTAYAYLGQCYFELSLIDSAARCYVQASMIDKENPYYYFNAGLAYMRMDSSAKALAAFQRAIAAHEPARVAQVYVQIGAVYFNKANYREAERAYAKALQFDDKNRDALFYTGMTSERLKKHQAAKKAFQTFLRVAGNDSTRAEKILYANKQLKLLEVLGY